jgi:hypothetical protein
VEEDEKEKLDEEKLIRKEELTREGKPNIEEEKINLNLEDAKERVNINSFD